LSCEFGENSFATRNCVALQKNYERCFNNNNNNTDNNNTDNNSYNNNKNDNDNNDNDNDENDDDNNNINNNNTDNNNNDNNNRNDNNDNGGAVFLYLAQGSVSSISITAKDSEKYILILSLPLPHVRVLAYV
jgi:hypothetical protein